MQPLVTMYHLLRLSLGVGTFILLTLVLFSVLRILLIPAIRTSEILTRNGESMLSGKERMTRVAYSPSDSSIVWITAATQHEQETSRVLRPSDSLPPHLSKHQADTLHRILRRLNGVDVPVWLLVGLPDAEAPTPRT